MTRRRWCRSCTRTTKSGPFSRSPHSRRWRVRRAHFFTPTPCSPWEKCPWTSQRWVSICFRSRATSSARQRAWGALWVRRGVRVTSQLTGGRQERSRRAGTENTAGLAGLGVAARYAKDTMTESATRIAGLRDQLESTILANVHGTAVNGDTAMRVPNTSNISFDGIEAESFAHCARPGRRGDLDRVRVFIGHTRAVACPAGDGSAFGPHA
jgi:hypothetical protein